MRMTNKIMQNNSLYNINNNKILQDNLSTQMSTQKKITRPSDDPVIAIRALRLRTNVSELTQYYDKNAPDAESWLDVTGKALSTVTDVLTEMSRQANAAANKNKGPEDLQIYLEQLKSLRDEFYATGNVDYAGRYVFTGYRTDTTMSFTKAIEDEQAANPGYPTYDIVEQNGIEKFDIINYTDAIKLDGMNKNNYTAAGYAGANEQDIRNGNIHRMRLAYDDLRGVGADGSDKISVEFPVGTKWDVEVVPLAHEPYQQALNANAMKDEAIIYVPETGEVLFSDSAYDEIEKKVNQAKNNNQPTDVRFTYTKDQWKDGDLRPEHYFACTAISKEADGSNKTVKYNQEYLTGEGKKQVIEYDVGYNQRIQVNTTADEVFNHNLDRDIDDLENALADLTDMNTIVQDLEEVLKGLDEGTTLYKETKLKYEAANKAYSYLRENVHSMFEGTISKMQGYLDDTNVAITDNGTRSQRLDLISNRLMDQKTTFKTLQSENEDADMAEVAVQLTSTELTYEAALMATGKIMQTSLMNYI